MAPIPPDPLPPPHTYISPSTAILHYAIASPHKGLWVCLACFFFLILPVDSIGIRPQYVIYFKVYQNDQQSLGNITSKNIPQLDMAPFESA